MAFRLVVLLAAVACANAGFLHGAAYGAAPAFGYAAAAPVLGSTYHGSYAAPALAYSAPAAVAAPAITSQHSNIIRSFGNLGQVSTYSKTVDTPFSSVRKADIRVSNPGVRFAAAAPVAAYAAPAVSTYHGFTAAPAVHAAPALAYGHAAPALAYGHAAPALAYGHAAPLAYGHTAAIAAHPAALGVAYSAAPAVSHINYASAYANYGW